MGNYCYFKHSKTRLMFYFDNAYTFPSKLIRSVKDLVVNKELTETGWTGSIFSCTFFILTDNSSLKFGNVVIAVRLCIPKTT